MKELKKELEDCIGLYVKKFCKKHDIEFEFWVSDMTGTVGCFADYYFNFEDIRLDLELDRPKDDIFDWYEQSLEIHRKGKETFNYYSWILAM